MGELERLRVDVRAKSDVWKRKSAVSELAQLNDPGAVLLLEEALVDSDFDIRNEAAAALKNRGWRPTNAGLAVALGHVTRTFDDAVHCYGREALDALLIALEHSSSSIRQNAASALGEIGDMKALNALERVALNDRDSTVASTASRAIVRIMESNGDREDLRTVLEDLLRKNVVALWNIKSLLERNTRLIDESMVQKAIHLFRYGHDDSGRSMLIKAYEAKPKLVADSLVLAFNGGDQGTNPYWFKRSIARTLGETGDPKGEEVFLGMLESTDADWKSVGIRGLLNIINRGQETTDENAIPLLLTLTKKPLLSKKAVGALIVILKVKVTTIPDSQLRTLVHLNDVKELHFVPAPPPDELLENEAVWSTVDCRDVRSLALQELRRREERQVS
ncbi:MAG: HEAT repeat domain-containing protein [Nitrospira defluvii]|nr:HEAT repeat domain-containing protein [Nitrospira defluvii]